MLNLINYDCIVSSELDLKHELDRINKKSHLTERGLSKSLICRYNDALYNCTLFKAT